MLPVQVQYWTMKENQRHNKVTESQTDTDLARRQKELEQTVYYNHNQVNYWRGQLAELTRHNKVTEKLSAKEIAIKRAQATASLRQADAALQQSLAALKNADTNAYNAITNRLGTNSQISVNRSTASRNLAETKKAEAQTSKIFKDTEKVEAETDLVNKKNQWYVVNEVALPAVKAVAEGYEKVQKGRYYGSKAKESKKKKKK